MTGTNHVDIWPLHLIVVALAEGRISRGLLDQLHASRAAGVIQLIDSGIVHKGNDGEISRRGCPGIELDPSPHTGKLVNVLFDIGPADESQRLKSEMARVMDAAPQLFGLSPDDLAEIADAIPRCSDALILLVEDRWSAGFTESVAAERGVVLAEGSIVPRTLLELSDDAESLANRG